MNIFLTATEARSKSRNDITVFNEIRDIEFQILQTIELGKLNAVITNTVMTTNTLYYNVWQKVSIDSSIADQMDQVINYFIVLGYTIVRMENTSINGVFYWSIAW